MSICVTIGKPIITEIDTCIHDGFVGFSYLNVNKEFLYYYLNILEPKFYSLSQTGSQANLNSDLVRISKIGVPSIKEQEQIVNFLSLVDKKIGLLEKKHQAYLDFKKYLMQQIFTQKLRFGDYPEGRKTVLKSILNERKQYTTNMEMFPHVTLSKKGILPKSERFDWEFLVKDKNKKYKITYFGDICYNPANLKFGVITLNTFGSAIFSPIYVTFEVKNVDNIIFHIF